MVGSLFQILIGNRRAINAANNNNCIQCAFCHKPCFESQNGLADIIRFMSCYSYCSQINVQLIIISVFESNNPPIEKNIVIYC